LMLYIAVLYCCPCVFMDTCLSPNCFNVSMVAEGNCLCCIHVWEYCSVFIKPQEWTGVLFYQPSPLIIQCTLSTITTGYGPRHIIGNRPVDIMKWDRR
jgi:hypothetical protein